MTADPVAVVEALVAAFNRRDATAIAGLLAHDVVCAGIPLEPAHGRAAASDRCRAGMARKARHAFGRAETLRFHDAAP